MRKYISKIKPQIAVYTFLLIITTIINVVIPTINANLLTNLTKFNIKLAFIFAISLLLITIIKVIFNKLSNHFSMKIREKILYNIRLDMIKQIFKMKIKNFDKTPKIRTSK